VNFKYTILVIGIIFSTFVAVLFYSNPEKKLTSQPIPLIITSENEYDAVEYGKRWCKINKDCSILASVGYYESRNQSDVGVIGVMRVVLNRVSNPRFPNTIKDVVYDGCQFSFVCDGSLNKAEQSHKQWDRMYSLAYRVLVLKEGKGDFHYSTHYHTTNVNPFWAKKFKPVVVLDDHIFYRCVGYC
jgi:hypothetical protein